MDEPRRANRLMVVWHKYFPGVMGLRKEERLQERRMRMKAMAGMIDFLCVIGCTILVIVLVAFIANLTTWLINDLTRSFSDLQKSVTEALIVQ